MLSKIIDESIREEGKRYNVKTGGQLYARILTKFRQDTHQGKTALFIHGGGSGGNHSMLVRPSRWFINQGLFDKIILPDKRGSGYSSPLIQKITHMDNAKDMKALLDEIGITEKVTVIGVSYGGPTALTLAGIDSRVDEAILIASSPSLKEAKGISGVLQRAGLLEPMVKFMYKRIIGKSNPDYVDYDCAYEISDIKELKKIFLEKMKHIEKDRLDSLILENASTLDHNNVGIPTDLRLDIPVYQIIGTKDEIWEVNIKEAYSHQLPNLKAKFIEGASHKDVFLRAEEFYQAVFDLVSRNRRA